jgi:hypothetical protein
MTGGAEAVFIRHPPAASSTDREVGPRRIRGPWLGDARVTNRLAEDLRRPSALACRGPRNKSKAWFAEVKQGVPRALVRL